MINPKAQTLLELYGVMDPQTRDWTDGILSKYFKIANTDIDRSGFEEKQQRDEIRWILFDGDVDAVWVENMNSVMDDNRLLTLSNGDRIRLESYCKLLFEVYDLQYASPATISRCGMVYVDVNNLGYQPFYMRWMNQYKKKFLQEQEMNEDNQIQTGKYHLEELYWKYIPQLVEYIYDGKIKSAIEQPFEMILPRNPLNLIQQLTNVFDSIQTQNINVLDISEIESYFIFAIIWSFGSVLNQEDKVKLMDFLRDNTTVLVPNNSLYDYYVDQTQWITWEQMLGAFTPPENGEFHKILVPTNDTVKYNYLINCFLKIKKPVLLVGEPGTSKTVVIQQNLRNQDADLFSTLSLNFSSRTVS